MSIGGPFVRRGTYPHFLGGTSAVRVSYASTSPDIVTLDILSLSRIITVCMPQCT